MACREEISDGKKGHPLSRSGRVFSASAGFMSYTKAATLNGAFTLLGDEKFFRKLTGLNPQHFVEDVRVSAGLSLPPEQSRN